MIGNGGFAHRQTTWNTPKSNKEEAKHALVGKVIPKQLVRTVVSEFCRENNKEDKDYIIPSYEIVVVEGDVVEVILSQASAFQGNLIVMGAGEGLLSGISVGKNIKSVLKKSKVPVLVVPASLG